MIQPKKIISFLFLLCISMLFFIGCTSNNMQAESESDSGTTLVNQAPPTAKESPTDKADTQPSADIITPSTEEEAENKFYAQEQDSNGITVEEGGTYSDKDHVALYIHTYGKLPDNFITKKEAEKLGWISKNGNMEEVAPGKSIGGSHFGNHEGVLPDKKGRSWKECDINFDGGYRNAERIIFSDDGLVYYTNDHYKTFEQLY